LGRKPARGDVGLVTGRCCSVLLSAALPGVPADGPSSAEGVPGADPGVPGDPRADPEVLPPFPNAAKALLVQLELCGAAGNAMCDGALPERLDGTPDVVLDLERVGIGAARIGEWWVARMERISVADTDWQRKNEGYERCTFG
jgi:hypothetical protein